MQTPLELEFLTVQIPARTGRARYDLVVDFAKAEVLYGEHDWPKTLMRSVQVVTAHEQLLGLTPGSRDDLVASLAALGATIVRQETKRYSSFVTALYHRGAGVWSPDWCPDDEDHHTAIVDRLAGRVAGDILDDLDGEADEDEDEDELDVDGEVPEVIVTLSADGVCVAHTVDGTPLRIVVKREGARPGRCSVLHDAIVEPDADLAVTLLGEEEPGDARADRRTDV